MSLNGGSYMQLFYGTQADVDPAYSLYIKKLGVGDTLELRRTLCEKRRLEPVLHHPERQHPGGGPGQWQTFRPPRSRSINPSTLASYLRPYLDAPGKVKIGPLSVLILMELGQTDRSQLVLRLSGHGAAGDVQHQTPQQRPRQQPGRRRFLQSRPRSGGPNGAVDPSGGVDDEIR